MGKLKEKSKGDKNKLQRRESNLEILRIIAIIMIIFYHLAVHSGFEFKSGTISVNKLWVQLVQINGKVGVNLFILISGYFLVNSKEIRLTKILKLWGQVFFTSCILYSIFVLSGKIEFNIKVFKQLLMPITYEEYWFISAYFVLYLISPFINIVLNKINQEKYKKMLCFMFIVWCIIPSITDMDFQSNFLMWFIVLYCIGGYIKLYGKNWNINNKECFYIAILLFFITYFFIIFADLMDIYIPILYIHNMQRVPVVLIALFLFLGFKNTNMKYSAIVNKIASTTLGIYLIHDSRFTQCFIWEDLFKVSAYQESYLLIPYSIVVCCLIFIGCALIELARIHTIEKWYMKAVYKIETIINNKNIKKAIRKD